MYTSCHSREQHKRVGKMYHTYDSLICGPIVSSCIRGLEANFRFGCSVDKAQNGGGTVFPFLECKLTTFTTYLSLCNVYSNFLGTLIVPLFACLFSFLVYFLLLCTNIIDFKNIDFLEHICSLSGCFYFYFSPFIYIVKMVYLSIHSSTYLSIYLSLSIHSYFIYLFLSLSIHLSIYHSFNLSKYLSTFQFISFYLPIYLAVHITYV